jgi:hypothetical protein
MDFQLVSKNSVGAVATLFLVILLSQARFFNFLIDTALGRAILILFILGISYTNKILGVVAVLFIIIAFNNSDTGYLEGYTSGPTSDTTSDATTDATTDSTIPNMSPNIKEKKDDVSEEKKTEGKGIEGFNIIEKEQQMLRGKRSSEVPVYPNARNQNDDVEPSDNSVFDGNYSSI